MALKLENSIMLENKDRTGGNPEDRVPYIQRDWHQEAEELLADYNRVVDILNEGE